MLRDKSVESCLHPVPTDLLIFKNNIHKIFFKETLSTVKSPGNKSAHIQNLSFVFSIPKEFRIWHYNITNTSHTGECESYKK